MSQHGAGHTRTAPRPTFLDLIKVVLRLGPKQINDEIQLAIGQLKTKGVTAGIAVGLMVAGLVFVTFLIVALIVAAVGAFALIFDVWAAALIVAGIFLLIALLFALVGYLRLKKALPLLPEDAIRGLRLDLGVAREGSGFDPKTLDREDAERRRRKEQAKKEAAERKKREAEQTGEGAPQKPPYRELLRRTSLRRDHLGSLQDQVRARLDKESLKAELRGAAGSARRRSSGGGTDSSDSAESGERAGAADYVQARWKPLAVLGASTAAGAVFLRELTKK